MQNTKVPSIYNIFCDSTGKSYIGSAVNPCRRYNEHVNDLRKGTHYNNYLQNSWNKYGEDNFTFGIIEEVGNKENLIEQEQFWMDYYDSYNPLFGFNLCPTAGSQLGIVRSEETRKRISNSKKGDKNPMYGVSPSEETRRKLSIASIGNKRALDYKHTKSACKKISDAMSNRVVSEETKQRLSDSQAQLFEVINPNGESQVIKGLNRFCKKNNLHSGHMSSVAMGNLPHHKNWKCRKLGVG